MLLTEEEQEAIENFQKYLRIATVHPNVNYDECTAFLTQLGFEVGLTVHLFNPNLSKPIVVMTYEGTDPTLPSLLLNSHMDVVPVQKKHWKHDPFGAEIDEFGNIYGRGAQDMKGVGMQFIEAVRRCIKEGQMFKRTIHLSFVPDEETGGEQGMGAFVETNEFKRLNVGCVIDESMPGETDVFNLCYAERSSWDLEITCTGVTGHGSLLIDNTAGEKLRYIIDKFMDFREEEKNKLLNNANLTLGDVTTVNLMIVNGGIQANVLPSTIKALFSLRIPVDIDCDKLLKTIHKWCQDAGDGVICKEICLDKNQEVTKLDDSNIWWMAFKSACDNMFV